MALADDPADGSGDTVGVEQHPGAGDQLELFPLEASETPAAPEPAADVVDAPTPTFADAAAQTLEDLRARLPLGTWLVSRVVEPHYTLLAVRSEVAVAGQTMRWDETLCRTMVGQGGARLVADVSAVPDYADRRMGRVFGVRGYTGVPLLGPGDQLLGTVCGLSRDPLDTDGFGVRSWLRVMEQHAGWLSGLLSAELAELPAQRTADHRVAQQRGDDLTGLADRRGWGFLLQREEQRAHAYAAPSGVLLLDLGATRSVGPVRRAAAAAASALAGRGSVVRLDGRQLGVLCTADDQRELRATADAVQSAVLASGCMFTSGWAVREPADGLPGAWRQAERRLMSVRRAPATA
ncbi:hypothetical protein [Kineococcus rhizosphaerae]|uniref:GAF domain-containing protein n=1 Tax=Kineococcus rhizosphaerae TaxID=559628 RepID=A0A2T0R6U7_9ACTN|nr:hypothetical protein [Kineococcus rhizosphaerae]PRY16873.1 hypothetical protein CLV37_103305 [Kineococcus rhizosphaerae]